MPGKHEPERAKGFEFLIFRSTNPWPEREKSEAANCGGFERRDPNPLP